MRTLIRDIEEFNRKFGLPVNSRELFAHASWLDYRMKFLLEELAETMQAVEDKDLHEVLDGLVDIMYVAVGTAVSLGLPIEEAWNRVHKANLEKVRVEAPEQSKRKSSFDLVKPPGWKRPVFDDLLGEP